MAVSTLIYRATVTNKADKGTPLEGLKGATEGFGPLKAVLQSLHSAVYADCQVCIQPPAQGSPLRTSFQGTVTVGGKIEGLISRVVALEERFNSPPNDVEEQRRRNELIRYAAAPPLWQVLTSF